LLNPGVGTTDEEGMKTLCFFFMLALTFTTQASSPVGSADNGYLVNADCLPKEGNGYMQLFRDVDRIWGTLPLINMIQKSAAEMSEKYPNRDRLQVEEMSAKNGGHIDGHKSHTNGLEADIGYFKADGIEHDPLKKNQYYADPMAVNGKVSANFDLERNWELVKAMHKHGDVQRIFMDSALKKELCRYAKEKNDYNGNIQVLRSLRHEENHADHMHVRLRCPKNEKKCVNQPEPPAGSGC
jgi:penicillin-insensitive murein endopeptidase